MDTKRILRGAARRTAKWGCLSVIVGVLVLTAAFFAAFGTQLYHRWSLYPRQAAAWKEHAANLQPVALQTGWNEYRGVMHSHSELSHDSEVSFPEILDAMHTAKCDFIFMSDHVDQGKADYSRGWRGIHDGVLFVQGYEMHNGFMPWGLPPDTVLDNNADPAEQARQIRALGGVLCLGHNEAHRPWEIPEIDGMEIYNIHTDMLDEMIDRPTRVETVKNLLLNARAFPEQTFRGMFDFAVLSMVQQKWDEQSRHRKITAIAANDCHQNVGLRGRYTAEDTLLLLDTGHSDPKKKVAEIPLNLLTRTLLRLCFGKFQPGDQLFRLDLDPYERSSRFVNTHLLAKELTEPALLDAVRQGRAFVAFNLLADAKGFAFVAEGGGRQVTMGDAIALTPDLTLRAEAPLPCKFTLYRNTKPLVTQDGKTFEYAVTQPGKYRVEAAIGMPGEITFAGDGVARDMAPWIIANPIEVVE